jgi:hypothetical protein
MKRQDMRPILLAFCMAFAITASTADEVLAQLNDVTWIGDPALAETWNDGANWDIGFVPSQPLGGDVAIINNGGTAFIDVAPPTIDPVAGLVLDNGALEIRSGGVLGVVVDPIGVMDARNGVALIGGPGLGRLDILPGGAASADTLTVGGNAASSLNLSGNAILSVVNNANLDRITRIEGPNVVFDVEGDLRVRGTFNSVITGPGHSPITAGSGSANVGGSLQVEFSGHTPAVGEAWTLIQANAVAGNFQNVQVSGAPSVQGALFQSVVAGGDVELRFTNVLTLNVNRRTGAASIENHIGTIDFDAYTISSAGGALTPGDWTSLDDAGETGWFEANPSANRLNELNPDLSTVLGPSDSLDLGSIIDAPRAFGEALPTLEFEYHQTADVVAKGIVQYLGPHNNLVLLVDPSTGQTALQNQSVEDVSLDGYSIGSAAGSLNVAGWNSFDDTNASAGTWFEANPSANRLNELNPDSSLFLPADGAPVPLGAAFNAVLGVRDLTLEFSLIGGGAGPLGDTNGDGVVNIDDLNNVRNNFGGAGLGDTNGDGVVNIDDLNNVRNNFGVMGGGGVGGTFVGVVEYVDLSNNAAAVPEPASWSMLIAGAIGLISISYFPPRRRYLRPSLRR